MSILLNHIISFAKVTDIDAYIRCYEKAGFCVRRESVRHAPGKRNRFIYIGTEYLELFWVEDKSKFRREANEREKYYRTHPRPFGLAFEARHLERFRQKKTKQGFSLPGIWKKAPADGDPNQPWWSFLHFPEKVLPGFWTFALTYLQRDWTKPRDARIGSNTIFGIVGITIVTHQPKTRAEKWATFFDFRLHKKAPGVYSCTLGPHTLEWRTASNLKKLYGLPTKIPANKDDQIALVHLVACDLSKAHAMLQKAGFRTKQLDDCVLVYPNKQDGFAFCVRVGDFAIWKKEREKCGITVTVEDYTAQLTV